MKKTFRAFAASLAIITAVTALFSLSACSGEPKIYYNYEYFGTGVKALFYTSQKQFDAFTLRADNTLAELYSEVGFDADGSDISVFNALSFGGEMQASERVYKLIQSAFEMFTATGGAFNPAVAACVDLWGFSARYSAQTYIMPYDRVYDSASGSLPLPAEEYVDAFKRLCDFGGVSARSDSETFYLKKTCPDVEVNGEKYALKLDLGGFIKGYAVDLLLEICSELNIDKGYISYGSSSMALLENKDGSDWNLELTAPRGSGTYIKTDVSRKSVSTSGDYEQFYVTDGVRYCHIIDGQTASPICNEMMCATVIGDNGALCDMLSTAVMVMGAKKARAFYSDYLEPRGMALLFAYESDGAYKVFRGGQAAEIVDDRFEYES